MDAITLLKDDHKTVEACSRSSRRPATRAVKTKRQLADQMIKELTTHAYIEENLFYPAARKAAPDTADHVLESIEEHHVVVWMLSELAGMDPADERFTAKVTVLIENVRHHVKEEEKDWFPQVRKAMGRKALRQLGEELAAAKSRAPADPLKNLSATGRAGLRAYSGSCGSVSGSGWRAWYCCRAAVTGGARGKSVVGRSMTHSRGVSTSRGVVFVLQQSAGWVETPPDSPGWRRPPGGRAATCCWLLRRGRCCGC